MENGVCGRAQTAGANSRRGATKKREISRNLFFHKSTLLSTCDRCPGLRPEFTGTLCTPYAMYAFTDWNVHLHSGETGMQEKTMESGRSCLDLEA